jgi:pimeloyl-ACP methyl ester carboxylesterase
MRIAPGRRKRLGLIPDLGVSRMEALLTRTGRVEVLRIGRGDPLVLLPGLAGGWRLLVPLARRLARTHEVVMVGLRGDRGLLDGGGGLTPRDHAEEVGRILDGLRLERPWLIGVSFGANGDSGPVSRRFVFDDRARGSGAISAAVGQSIRQSVFQPAPWRASGFAAAGAVCGGAMLGDGPGSYSGSNASAEWV